MTHQPRLPNPRTIDAIAVVTCLALAALVFVVGVMPLLEQRRQQRQTRQHLAHQHQQVETTQATLSNMRDRQRDLERSLEQYPLRLEPIDNLNRRLARITEVANHAGLQLDRLRPGRAQAGEHFQQIPVAVTGHGPYDALALFLHNAREQLPDVALRHIDIQGRPDPGAQTSFTLELTWYAAPGPGGDTSARR
ncbi:MAG: type 4a pilus biogenesis protein PilO [Phycisphaeraceae bacterium]